MISRRRFLHRGAQFGLVSASSCLWKSPFSARAFAQMASSSYKACVIITMAGGNDGNNMIVPVDSYEYSEYSAIRGALALAASSLIPLQSASGSPSYGLHPSLVNLASLYNQKRAAIVANVGPLAVPVTKSGLLAGTSPYPEALFSHPAGISEWESSTAVQSSLTGWGGRMADILKAQSGNLPPVLNGGVQSLFTVGETIQAVSVQSGLDFQPLSPDLQSVVAQIAKNDLTSTNALVQQAAQIRASSMQQQALLTQAQSSASLKTQFPSDGFGSTMRTIAQLIAGRSVVGASRQIFYTQQGAYDSHAGQIPLHAGNFQSLDQGLGAFFGALDEIGMTDQVLVCTHSDFNRTYTSNVNAGSDHGWGSHQLIMGGGISGGRVLGAMPTIELNGPDDLNGFGIWVPTTSVTQLTSSIGSWMGLNAAQINTVFPDLVNFPNGAVKLI